MENTNNNVLKIKNLCTYPYTDSGVIRSVDGVDIELREESTPEIVGESGSGKSVTALSVIGLPMGTTGKVAEGEILSEGRDSTELDDEERRKMHGEKILMIFQEPMTSLNPIMRIGDQITECILIYNSVNRQEAWDKAVEMLKLTGVPGVEHMMKEYPLQLSGGQRRKVIIAMALVYRPKILIADEPTIALDVTIQTQILDLMENLKRKTGTSILFTTHDPGVVAEVCDDAVVICSGRAVEKGDMRSIFANPSHPYTRGPPASTPKPGEYAKKPESTPDNVPSPKYMPQGYKFVPKCSCAFDKYREEEPGFYDVGGGHMSRCQLCKKKGGDAWWQIPC